MSRAFPRTGIIDIGSNSIRQIVADVSGDGTIRVVDEMKAAPRLGAGLAKSGLLDDERMDDAVEAQAISDAVTFKPVSLTDGEIDAIMAFLESLSDPVALEGRLGVPEVVPSGLRVPRP